MLNCVRVYEDFGYKKILYRDYIVLGWFNLIMLNFIII
jgi:hypothetical protein